MPRLHKAQLKFIKQVCNNLPVVLNHTNEYHLLKGSEIIQMYNETGPDVMNGIDVDIQDINPNATYRYCLPVQLFQNHFRRLRKLCEKKGSQAIPEYINRIKLLYKLNYQQNTMTAVGRTLGAVYGNN